MNVHLNNSRQLLRNSPLFTQRDVFTSVYLFRHSDKRTVRDSNPQGCYALSVFKTEAFPIMITVHKKTANEDKERLNSFVIIAVFCPVFCQRRISDKEIAPFRYLDYCE